MVNLAKKGYREDLGMEGSRPLAVFTGGIAQGTISFARRLHVAGFTICCINANDVHHSLEDAKIPHETVSDREMVKKGE